MISLENYSMSPSVHRWSLKSSSWTWNAQWLLAAPDKTLADAERQNRKKNSTVLVNECVRWHQKVSFANGGLPVQKKKNLSAAAHKNFRLKFSWCNVAGWKVQWNASKSQPVLKNEKNRLWVVSPPNQWPHSRFAMNDKEPRLPMVGKDGGGKYTSGKWDSNNTVQVWRLRHHS